MNISVDAIYQSDCLALLERIESGQVTLACIDAPSENKKKHSSKQKTPS